MARGWGWGWGGIGTHKKKMNVFFKQSFRRQTFANEK